jgi:heme iron utilization protein
MKIASEVLIHHLHEGAYGALGTHSRHVAGFPFVTVLPYVPDEHHRPVFLMSALAEHTKNALDDPRASFLVFKPKHGDVLAGARATLVGEIRPIPADDNLIDRYHRYHPKADRYSQLSDFAFFRLETQSVRLIAGFGEMGWIDGAALPDADSLDSATEAKLLQDLAASQPPHVRTLGVDHYGLDITVKGKRERQRFPDSPLDPALIGEAARRILQNRS